MKKWIAILLSLCLCLSLCACGVTRDGRGRDDDDDDKGGVVDNWDEKDNGDDDVTGPSTDIPGASGDNSGDEGDASVSAAPYTRGTFTNNSYSSRFIGLGFTLEKGWEFLDDETLVSVYGEMDGYIGSAELIYELVASNENGDNININLEKADPAVLSTLNVKDNFEKLAPLMESMMTDAGAVNITSSVEMVNIQGKEFGALRLSYGLMGMSVEQLCIGTVCGEYLANITLTGFTADVDELVDNFYLIY